MAMRAARIPIAGIIMIDRAALTAATRLAYWLSPAFPTGAFAYSHGLEFAFEEGLIPSKDAFEAWLRDLLHHGSARSDTILCSLSWRAQGIEQDLRALADFAASFASSAERHKETVEQGDAFQAAAGEWACVGALPKGTPLPICVGAAARAAGMDQGQTLCTYLTSFVSNLVQAALRLGQFGQQDGVAIMASLEGPIIDAALDASTARLEDIAASTVAADLSAIGHETMATRIFLT